MNTDLLDALRAIAPTAPALDAEWGADARRRMLTAILDDQPGRARMRFTPRRRLALLAPVAASAAVVAVVGGAAVLGGSGGAPNHAPRPRVGAGGVTPTDRVAAGQLAYRADTAYRVRGDGQATMLQRNENWAGPNGQIWSRQTTDRGSECFDFGAPRTANFETPDQALFDSMPTEPVALNDYLRSRVSGSTSRDEAVFVAVGDMLRNSDGLATSALRAALVQVLAANDRVTVHTGVRDYLGRPAVRADFVDQRNRPGQLDSLYFDPDTYRLLEERLGSSGQPTTPAPGPSEPYDATTADKPQTDPDLTGAANIDVMTAERVVDALPTTMQDCAAH